MSRQNIKYMVKVNQLSNGLSILYMHTHIMHSTQSHTPNIHTCSYIPSVAPTPGVVGISKVTVGLTGLLEDVVDKVAV